jgi:eukaryotic-like serine/threonine-protein kinase
METNKCPKCGAVLSANAPEGLCPRCLMSQGLEEAAQEHKPRRSPAMNNDRNLLFGVLAVQLRKVTPVQLMDIAGSWAMDPSRSLQDRLIEAGVISKEDCEFVNDVVDRAIQSHGGDPSATLNSFGGDEQIHQSFAGSIVRTSDGEISSGRGLKIDDEHERLDTVDEIPGRYTHISEYSHGGMGRILLVHDQHLGRDIAMKELLPSPGGAKEDTPQTPVRQAMPMIARFLQEARITGQLEHPAIVPVYELGGARTEPCTTP